MPRRFVRPQMPGRAPSSWKRKHESDETDERSSSRPPLKRHQTIPSGPHLNNGRAHGESVYMPVTSIAVPNPESQNHHQFPNSAIQLTQTPNPTNQDPPEQVGRTFRVPGSSDRSSSLSEWMERAYSLNSVRPPDTLEFTESIPWDIVPIAPFLFRPRPPPNLPRHILALRFETVLRRYNRFTKMIDNYHKWHGLQVFAFWTREEFELARTAQSPDLMRALLLERPSIPQRILNTRFDHVLLAAPFLSHLIERYHKDMGLDYFAFFHPGDDPRGDRYVSDVEES
ncbi:hypothetical protein F4777DRAFT_508253 [Nemania sp. FL0916]|nr:hypothetical protein F4777DRAFT_508253 [Nemania sp. FL0916]